MSKTVILIPARYESSRFPGKPLKEILGKSMIRHVYENVRESGFETYVVTDDHRIEDHVKEFGKCLRVDDPVTSGSDRIYLAFERFLKDKGFDLIINVQGDEPLLKGEHIKSLDQFHRNSDFEITTFVKRNTLNDTEEDFKNPNRVKAVLSHKTSQCLYFSRSPIPNDRNQKLKDWFLHIGVYCYSNSALKEFNEAPHSFLEEVESLEQLKALEIGLKIGAIEIKDQLHGVDTPEDINIVEGVLGGKTN